MEMQHIIYLQESSGQPHMTSESESESESE